MNKHKINGYINKDSIIHKVNPIIKILLLILNVIVILNVSNIVSYIILYIYLVCVMILSKINIKYYLRNILTMKIFILFILIINFIFGYSIIESARIILNVIYIVICSSIISYTTSTLSINYALEKIFGVFNFIIPSRYIALTIGLSIRFIPIITMEAERITNSISLRGVEYSSIRGKITTISYLFIPLIYLSIKRSEVLASVMEVRLYNTNVKRTYYMYDKLRSKDYVILILNIIILSVTMLFGGRL